MARKWTPESTTAYTYYPAEGKPITVSLEDEGVTEDLIAFLHASDHEAHLQDRYQEENTDFGFLNQAARCVSDPDHEENPYDRIEDKNSDVWEVLFPEDAVLSGQLERLTEIMSGLTDSQRDLIHRLYGEQKRPADIAREDGVSKTAVFNRQKKLMDRIRKLLEETETC